MATVVVGCVCAEYHGQKNMYYKLKVLCCLREFLLVANNVTMATILIEYKVVQSLMLIHNTIVK